MELGYPCLVGPDDEDSAKAERAQEQRNPTPLHVHEAAPPSHQADPMRQ